MRSARPWSSQLWFVVLLMLSAALLLHLRGDVDRVPPSRPLQMLNWSRQSKCVVTAFNRPATPAR